jgi:hypothetical protein
MTNLLDRRIGIERAAEICGVPVPWLRLVAATETLTVRESLELARSYQRDETVEHRRLRWLAAAEETPGGRRRQPAYRPRRGPT